MIKLFFLISPIIVSLFWFIMLNGNREMDSKPRIFLSKFMLIAAYIFTTHFLYFAPLPGFFPYFDCGLVLTGLLAYPLYHIYFRLLTVDEKFSFKDHHRYLVIPVVLFLLYTSAVLMTPWNEYKIWLFKGLTSDASPKIQILQVLRKVIVIVFILQLLLSIIGNHWLIIKYGPKAMHFYSDIRDGKNRYSKMLNYSILAMSIASLVAILLGRFFLMSKDVVICVVWTIFSVSLYGMGYLGLKQKLINPSIDPANGMEYLVPSPELTAIERRKLLDRIIEEFTVNKIYLNNNLIIMDLVKSVGTNRSYISAAINQQYNQNFCTFINSYRVEELKSVLLRDPLCTTVELAEVCGFGSVNSMKRAVSAKTGLLFTVFKKQIYEEQQKEFYTASMP